MKLKCSALFIIAVVIDAFSISDNVINSSDSTLPFKKLLQLAIENGTDAKLSKNRIREQVLNVKNASSKFLPSVSTGFRANSDWSRNRSWGSSSGLSAGATYEFTPSSFPSLHSAQKKMDATEYDYQQTLDAITTNATLAYIEAVYALKNSNISVNDYDYQKLKLQQIEEYRGAGKKSLSDVLQQQAETAQSEATVLEAQQAYNRAMLSLFDLASLPLDSRLVPDTNSFNLLLQNAVQGDSSALPQLDLNKIAQYQSKKREIEAAELSLRGSNAAYIPSIRAELNNGSEISGTGGIGIPDLQASISISYPLFDKFDRKNKIDAANLSLDNVHIELTELEKSIRLEYQNALSNLKVAHKQMEVSMVRLIAAKQSFDAVTARYESGMSTFVETALANKNYIDAINARLKAENTILTSYITLLKITGQTHLLTDENVQ
jgi:outer membrane protein